MTEPVTSSSTAQWKSFYAKSWYLYKSIRMKCCKKNSQCHKLHYTQMCMTVSTGEKKKRKYCHASAGYCLLWVELWKLKTWKLSWKNQFLCCYVFFALYFDGSTLFSPYQILFRQIKAILYELKHQQISLLFILNSMELLCICIAYCIWFNVLMDKLQK